MISPAQIVKGILLAALLGGSVEATSSKEIALTFDDAPVATSPHAESLARTRLLIRKLKALNTPPVMVFANPCKGNDSSGTIGQLKEYRSAGHHIANHTCSHPRLDTVGFETFSRDAERGSTLLAPLFSGQKFFRYPYLNEGTEPKLRNQMRQWLAQNGYRNGMVSVDNDDYLFSFKINQAKKLGKKIDDERVKTLFLNHLLGAADFYDALALKTLGRSPKHVMLLHEMDATVLYLDDLVRELRKRGWKIIDPLEAYQDPLYAESPQNTYAGNGIIAQVAYEETGERVGYRQFDALKAELNRILGL